MKDIKGLTEEEYLEKYNSSKYEKPSLTVDILLFTLDEIRNEDIKRLPEKELKILLIKRNEHPFIGTWGISGGFVDINESVDNAAYRELTKDANIEDVYMEQLYTWGEVNRDPRMRVVSASYIALVNKQGLKEKAGDEVNDLAWFSISKELISDYTTKNGQLIKNYIISLISNEKDIKIIYKIKETNIFIGFNTKVDYKFEVEKSSNSKLAFDHVEILSYALERMSNKVQYTTIAFSLLSKNFTLTELQQVYELLLGRKLTKPNFRRWISKIVEETSYTKREGSYRPSKLYTLNKKLILKEFINI
ncbi:NUDIX hydrolase [Clostridium gasigenes]|uniref:NUDIX hydrolase n=1 Tax=Clostridium gasigenes TaxID=94869 RepID=UPI001C0B2681|nr:NUDIX domain-containing protein [Clostridium gasigenes]MBU3087481.1 NUDIX hydrolase [Clostridium gasigenes]